MFPLVDSRGRLRPLLHHVCMEASAAGISNVAIISNPQQTDLLHRYFTAAGKESAAELPVNIDFLAQPQPRGLGDAVMLAEYYASGEPLLMLLGDHAWVSDERVRPSAAQVVDAYAERRGAAMIGVQVVAAETLPSVGAARGRLVKDRLYLCEDIIEKPPAAVARQRLVCPDLGPEKYLAHNGIYLFSPEIFDCLRELGRAYRQAGEELQLTGAQQLLLRRHPQDYFLVHVAGRCMDCGSPAGYAEAFDAIRKAPCRN
jgi:UTP--glucose-1-phosphate uridylyltransferase